MPVQLILYSIITKDIQKTLKMKDEPWVYNCLLSLGLLFLMYLLRLLNIGLIKATLGAALKFF